MKPTLLILAAGMGSRYGGLKQLDQLGPHGETIMDYSVNDAMAAGFGKVVFVIRKHMEEDAQSAEDRRERDEISEYLLKKASFAVPESMVLASLDRKLEDVIRAEVAAAGAQDAKAYAKEHAAEIQKKAREIAERQVRLDYILAGIAAEQKIEVTADEVQKEIDSAAQYYAMQSRDKTITPAKLRQNLEESGNMVLLKTDLLSAKVLKWLADELKSDGK